MHSDLTKFWLLLKKAVDKKDKNFFYFSGVTDLFENFPKNENQLIEYFQKKPKHQLSMVLNSLTGLFEEQKENIWKIITNKKESWKTQLSTVDNMQSQFVQEKQKNAYDSAYLQYIATLMLAQNMAKK